jgi:hypothetical protein
MRCPCRRSAILSILLACLTAPWAARGHPLDLADPSPRWVQVRFETSPADDPGRLRGAFGPRLRAWLEPAAEAGQVRVTLPAREVEERLFVGERVVPGSFGDFVWTFDAASGHVLGASLAGRLVRTLDWGLMRTDAEVDIQVELDTLRATGYAPARRRLGNTVFALCAPAQPGCTAVPHAPLDPRSGYVNAVGSISARALRIRAVSFSPLGEAVFSEMADAEAVGFAPVPELR